MALRSGLLAFCILTSSLTGAISVRPRLDNHGCKVICQRFGMKSLGEEFKDIENPTDCVAKCDEVFAADSRINFAAKPESGLKLPVKR
mmetsp:Transcript_40556/g.63641  ORF Transcript_40556/g.63641 Transcript_40556/m.63641 type:complete len:88 (-) Transcript_40556:137-400(-)